MALKIVHINRVNLERQQQIKELAKELVEEWRIRDRKETKRLFPNHKFKDEQSAKIRS